MQNRKSIRQNAIYICADAKQESKVGMGESMESMSWDDLKLVLALSREGSLLGASKVLDVNVSTVSRRLEAIEESLDIRIFDRTRRGVQMTAVAEELLPFAEAAEQAAMGFRRVAEGFEREIEGNVRISAPPGLASFLLGRWVFEWWKRYPKLTLHIDAQVGYADLSRREADIALRGHRPTRGDLVAVKWIEARPTIMAHPSYVKEVGEVQSLGDLRWIAWGPKLNHIPEGLWTTENVPAKSIVVTSDSYEVKMMAASSGMGVILLAEPLGRLEGLEPVCLSESLQASLPPPPMGELWQVTHRALRNVPRIAAIWEALLEKGAASRKAMEKEERDFRSFTNPPSI
jgi:DNA-binding transcriptional LysR family regulator